MPACGGLAYAMSSPVKQDLIRVLLVDESMLSREGLKAILRHEKTITVVGEACTGTEAFAAVQHYHPHVIVMDVQLGDSRSIEACRAIRGGYPDISILCLTAENDTELFRSAVRAGAQGYLLKTAEGKAIVNAIKALSAGQSTLDPSVTENLMSWIRQSCLAQKPVTKDLLSSHDMQVLFLVSSGKVTDEIAKTLNLPPRAVKSRLRNIYKQLHISRRSQAASYYALHDKTLDRSASPPEIQGEREIILNRNQT
jgi:DNA-binding NarL/FixJ family response regulator